MNYFSHRNEIYLVKHGYLFKTLGKNTGQVTKPGRLLRIKAEKFGYINIKT